MRKLPWAPSRERIRQVNMMRFADFVNRKYSLELQSCWQLNRWSIDNLPDFWTAMWSFGHLVASRPCHSVVDDLSRFPVAKCFVVGRLNFAENLLRHRDDRLAFVSVGESQRTARMTFSEVYDEVARLARSLRDRSGR